MRVRRICEICGRNSGELLKHLEVYHNVEPMEYYMNYIVPMETRPTCAHKNCSEETKFLGFGKGFADYCSTSCHNSVNTSERNLQYNEYRRTHNGLGYYEYKLWINEQFQNLKPLSQDRRFSIMKPKDEKTGYLTGWEKIVTMDFSLPQYNLCIELDGESYHDPEKDAERDRYLLETHGWRTLRFSNEEVENNIDNVVKMIYTFIGIE